MNTRERLDAYIRQLEARLRLGAIIRGGAILTSAALAGTVALVFFANLFAFSSGSITGARIGLLLCLAFAIGFGLAVPLYGLDRKGAAKKAERVFPKFEQRLVTFAERNHRDDTNDAMLELLAADALDMAEAAPARRVVSDKMLAGSVAFGTASLGVLIWLIVAGPGYMGHGASLLWTGRLRSATPLYDLQVTPGDVSVRRNGAQIVTAQVTGLQPSNVRLYARSQSASKWEQLPMQAQASASGYQYLFSEVPEGLEYYVEAGPLESRHFNIKVLDLPAVKQIKVTYRYPTWMRQPNLVDEHGGDLRAIEGTDADLEITTDRPLKDGALVMGDGRQLKLGAGLSGNADVYRGTVHIDRDGSYHVAAQDSGQQVSISYDFFIQAQKANGPDVQVMRPGHDYHASPIEEVTVNVKAAAELGLGDVALHYSVNGGAEKTVDLLKDKGAKAADGATTLYLEDYKMAPGDLISLYATARDARTESHTGMFFIQADAFEGDPVLDQVGGNANQADAGEISQREKDIIAQTWQQQGGPSDEAAETGKFLASLQSKLRGQILSLEGRMESRSLAEQSPAVKTFQRELNNAALAMEPAEQKLGQQKWTDAISSEEKALQSLLRGEATFRQLQAAAGPRGDDTSRALANLFNLEFNTQKNQFDGGAKTASANQQAADIADTVQKLDDLAHRQQALADQRGNAQPSAQDRQQQEVLRREADDLLKQVEQMAQKLSAQQGPNGQADGGSPGQGAGGGAASNAGASAANGTAGKQQATDPRVQQVLDRLRQAQQSMERAATEPNASDARNAADQLEQAANLLDQLRPQDPHQLDELAQQVADLLDQARAQTDQLEQLRQQAAKPGQTAAQEDLLDRQRQNLADDRARLAAQIQKLENQLQQSQKGLAAGQKEASAKLQDALAQMQQLDLINRVKKSAQSLKDGSDANSSISEADISKSLEQVGDRVKAAEQAIAAQGTNQNNLAAVEKIRNQMQTVIKSTEPNSKPPIFLSGEDANGEGLAGRSGAADNDTVDGLTPGQNGIIMGLNGQRGDVGGAFTEGAKDLRDQQPGVNPGSRGNSSPQGGAGARDKGTAHDVNALSQTEIDRVIQQAQAELTTLKQGAQGQSLADINDLQEQIKRLQASHSADAAALRALQARVLATVDKLELQMRRDVDDKEATPVRSGDTLRVPSGYQESVAEYFRRLSKAQNQSQ